MPCKYKYRAKKGALYLTGSVEAQNEEEAAAKLQQQGMTIISLNKDVALEDVSFRAEPSPQKEKTESTEKFDIFTSKRERTSKIIQEEKPPLIDPRTKKIIGYVIGGVFGVFCLSLLPFVFRGQSSSGGGKNKNVVYSIVKVKDVKADPGIKDFVIKVEKAASKNGIKDVALKVLARKKGEFKDKERAIFHFFYKNQDADIQKAAAVLRWNWSGDKRWEYSFSLSRGSDTDKQVQIKKKELNKGQYVKYDIIVPSSIKVNGAKAMVKKEIEKLQKKWAQKVKSIKVDAIYENFEAPFMICEVDAKPGSYRARDCRLITKRF